MFSTKICIKKCNAFAFPLRYFVVAGFQSSKILFSGAGLPMSKVHEVVHFLIENDSVTQKEYSCQPIRNEFESLRG